MKKPISFIIPAFNESRYIESCIKSVIECSNSSDLDVEIIVVNNGSTDNTLELIKQFDVNVYSVERGSVSYARNFGVSKSKHPIIAFIDGDVEITPEWVNTVSKNYESFVSNPMFLAGDQYDVPDYGSWIEKHWFKNIEDKYLAGGNIITSRKVFDEIKGFDEKLKTGEDYDFVIRCLNINCEYFVEKGYRTIHLGFPHTLKDFVKREIWHGEGDFKSFERFCGSIVAQIAMIFFTLIIVSIIAAITGCYKIVWCSLGLLILINTLVTLKRFYKCGLKTIAFNWILNLVYFFSRIGSLYRAIKNRNLRY